MLDLEYMTDKNGRLKAVVIPVALWEKLFVEEDDSPRAFSPSL